MPEIFIPHEKIKENEEVRPIFGNALNELEKEYKNDSLKINQDDRYKTMVKRRIGLLLRNFNQAEREYESREAELKEVGSEDNREELEQERDGLKNSVAKIKNALNIGKGMLDDTKKSDKLVRRSIIGKIYEKKREHDEVQSKLERLNERLDFMDGITSLNLLNRFKTDAFKEKKTELESKLKSLDKVAETDLTPEKKETLGMLNELTNIMEDAVNLPLSYPKVKQLLGSLNQMIGNKDIDIFDLSPKRLLGEEQ